MLYLGHQRTKLYIPRNYKVKAQLRFIDVFLDSIMILLKILLILLAIISPLPIMKSLEEITSIYRIIINLHDTINSRMDDFELLRNSPIPRSIHYMSSSGYKFYTGLELNNSKETAFIDFDDDKQAFILIHNKDRNRRVKMNNPPLAYDDWLAATKTVTRSGEYYYIYTFQDPCKYAIHESSQQVWWKEELAGYICIAYTEDNINKASSIYLYNVLWWLWVIRPISIAWATEQDFMFHIKGPYYGYIYKRDDTRHIY